MTMFIPNESKCISCIIFWKILGCIQVYRNFYTPLLKILQLKESKSSNFSFSTFFSLSYQRWCIGRCLYTDMQPSVVLIFFNVNLNGIIIFRFLSFFLSVGRLLNSAD